MLKKILVKLLVLQFVLLSVVFGKDITIFFTNDVHSRVIENRSEIGYAKLSSYIKSYKETNPNTLYFDAGDTFHGTNIAILEEGVSIVEILNAVGLDAMVLGNHDFNYGYDQVLELEKLANFSILASNIVDATSKKKIFKENHIFEVDGLKVGVFGISTPETKYKTAPSNVENLDFLDIQSEAKKQVSLLKKQNVDIIIALVHLGIDGSTKEHERSTSLENVKGIDLVIDGHSHDLLEDIKVLKNNVRLIQVGEYGKYLGKIVISIDDNSKEKSYDFEFLNNDYFASNTPDAEVVAITAKYVEEHNKFLKQKITTSNIVLNGERETVRKGESNLGQLTTDIFIQETGADIAVVNGGGIRASIQKGEILLEDVKNVFPFNILVTTTINGKEIKKMLKSSVGDVPELSGAFLHVGGMTFDVDLSKKKGKRVSNIKIRGREVDNNKVYTIALPDFVFETKEGSDVFEGKSIDRYYSTMDDVIIEHLKNIDLTKLKTEVRINFINGNE